MKGGKKEGVSHKLSSHTATVFMKETVLDLPSMCLLVPVVLEGRAGFWPGCLSCFVSSQARDLF